MDAMREQDLMPGLLHVSTTTTTRWLAAACDIGMCKYILLFAYHCLLSCSTAAAGHCTRATRTFAGLLQLSGISPWPV